MAALYNECVVPAAVVTHTHRDKKAIKGSNTDPSTVNCHPSSTPRQKNNSGPHAKGLCTWIARSVYIRPAANNVRQRPIP
jgi:hypothetical protein